MAFFGHFAALCGGIAGRFGTVNMRDRSGQTGGCSVNFTAADRLGFKVAALLLKLLTLPIHLCQAIADLPQLPLKCGTFGLGRGDNFGRGGNSVFNGFGGAIGLG
jgi:hypothetical protein